MDMLPEIEAYLARSKIAPSRFGRTVVGDPRFVEDLRAGRRPRRKTLEKVRLYLSEARSDPADTGAHTPSL
jgi:hypothetical protein